MAATGSSAALFLFFEVLVMKLAFYLLAGNHPSPPFFDLCAYSGYKCVTVCLLCSMLRARLLIRFACYCSVCIRYVALVLSLCVGLVFGATAFTIVNVLGGCMIAIFMMRTMTVLFFPAVVQTSGQSRNYYLLAIGLPQIPIVMLLGRSAFV